MKKLIFLVILVTVLSGCSRMALQQAKVACLPLSFAPIVGSIVCIPVTVASWVFPPKGHPTTKKVAVPCADVVDSEDNSSCEDADGSEKGIDSKDGTFVVAEKVEPLS